MATENKGIDNKGFEKSQELSLAVSKAPSGSSSSTKASNRKKRKTFEGEVVPRTLLNPTSDYETLVHLLKGNIGSGILALPSAFLNSGLWVGLAGIPILGGICIHCMLMILNCSRTLCRRGQYSSLSYEETTEIAFKLGPKPVRKFQNLIATSVITFLIITQLGFCCVYFVFVSQNMYQAIECMVGPTNLTEFDYLCFALVPILLICYIPDLKYLAPVSLIASILQTVGLVIIFYYLIRDLPHIETPVVAFAGWSTMPLYFGTALFAFEGIGLVLPLENNMKSPNSFPGATGVLCTGMYLVVCAYASVGFFGYLRYGSSVLGSITLNLPGDEVLSQSVKIMMSITMICTFGVQYYVPLQILLPFFRKRVESKTSKFIVEYVLRTAIVLFTFVLASLIPNIGLFTNLIGSISSSALALFFPPLVDIVTFWPDMGKNNWRLYKNIAIMAFALLGFTTGVLSSIKEIVIYFKESDKVLNLVC